MKVYAIEMLRRFSVHSYSSGIKDTSNVERPTSDPAGTGPRVDLPPLPIGKQRLMPEEVKTSVARSTASVEHGIICCRLAESSPQVLNACRLQPFADASL